jgi:hypothetical protein
MYEEDQVTPKGGCQDCNMPNQNLKKCKHDVIKLSTWCTLHPKSATDWADG